MSIPTRNICQYSSNILYCLAYDIFLLVLVSEHHHQPLMVDERISWTLSRDCNGASHCLTIDDLQTCEEKWPKVQQPYTCLIENPTRIPTCPISHFGLFVAPTMWGDPDSGGGGAGCRNWALPSELFLASTVFHYYDRTYFYTRSNVLSVVMFENYDAFLFIFDKKYNCIEMLCLHLIFKV